jgi:hypothetical protein
MRYARTGWGIGAVAGFAGVVFACSSTPGPLYPQISDFCTAYAKATCGESNFCGTPLAACEAEQDQLCQTNATTATSDGNRQYMANNAPPCVNQAQTTYSSDTVTFAALTSLVATCANVFVGNIAPAGACTSAYDCANEAAGVTCAQGICVAQTIVQQGPTGFCGQPSEVCASGSYCDLTATPSPVCTADAEQGSPCSDAVPCEPTLHCVSGLCQPRSLTGGSCESNTDCDPSAPLCDVFDGFICTNQLIFSPAEKALCQNYGGGTATPFDAGPPPVTVNDSGTATDSSPTIPTDGGAD